MSHVKKAQAYTHWPTGCPNPNRARMKDPSLHEPSNKVLKMKTWSCSFLDESPQKGQSTTSLPSIKASPSTWKKARWIYPNSKPIKGGSSHEIMKRIRAHQRLYYMKGSESIQIAQKMTAIKRPKPI